MRKNTSIITSAVVLSLTILPCSLVFADELYLFREGKTLLITDVPSSGYMKKVSDCRGSTGVTAQNIACARYDRMIEEICDMHSLSPDLVKAVIQVESAYDCRAVSPKGAKGLMQLIDDTARRFGVRDVFDPYENILGGAKYLRYLLDFFEGDLSLALAAYNAGEKAVLDYGGMPPFAETIMYVRNVRQLLGFSGSGKSGKASPREAKPYIALSKSGTISIIN